MLGGIYTRQRCPLCGKKMVDNRVNACACPDHPDQKATRFEVIFRGIGRRFSDYRAAFQFLTGLRHEVTQGKFDPRDYRKDNPLGFSTLAGQYLEYKRPRVKWSSWRNLRSYMTRAVEFFGERNIKDIKSADLDDLIQSLPLSGKTRHNAASCLRNFYRWLIDREVITAAPKVPKVSYVLGMRRTIDKATQQAILDELARITRHDPKVAFGVRLLCTYISIRPNELRRLRECDINLEEGFLFFSDPKEKKPKVVPITREDVEAFRGFGAGRTDIPFFRHAAVKGTPEGHPFSKNVFYDWWRRACRNLGIEGVDLYGGTRHSSARALRTQLTPEAIKRLTMHSTNAAFERYFQLDAEDLRRMYGLAQPEVSKIGADPAKDLLKPAKKVLKVFEGSKNCKILKIKE